MSSETYSILMHHRSAFKEYVIATLEAPKITYTKKTNRKNST